MKNYYAWCIVPFDSMKRTHTERIEMLKELGFTSYAYDWRDENLDSFADEINLARANDIEITAVWLWIDARNDSVGRLNDSSERMLQIVKETNLKTQIWVGFHSNYFDNLDQISAVSKGIDIAEYLSIRAEEIGCKLALYNHGDWFGDPRNQVQIIKQIPEREIGIIYNFHHAHDQLKDYDEIIDAALPYLWSVNLNGMQREGPKILTIGEGDLEKQMIEKLDSSGFGGPFGILCHIETEDARVVLARNLHGLKSILN